MMMMTIDNEDTLSDPTCKKQHCVGWFVEMDDSNGLVSSTHPLASAMHRPATRGSPRQPRPGPPGPAQTRRRATQGAAGCHRQRHGEAKKEEVFFQ